MYVIMCEVKRHTNTGHLNDRVTLVSAHPIDIADTDAAAENWMIREPPIILDYLNNLHEDVWEMGEHSPCKAHIWNKAKTIERIYLPKHIL